MRGSTVKKLRVYVDFLLRQDAEFPQAERKFSNFTRQNMERQVKRLWHKDPVFQQFIQAAVTTKPKPA